MLAYASEKPKTKPREVRIIIDVSGSMKKTDPDNLRVPATKMLINLLPKDVHGGVWLFGQDVQKITSSGAADQQWKESSVVQAGSIHSRGLFTNIGKALETVTNDWEVGAKPGLRSVIILTDGLVDVSKNPDLNSEARNHILKNIIPKLQAKKVNVYTVALSDNTDEALLKQLAFSTDGFYRKAKNARQLERSFFKLFESAVKQDELPIKKGEFKVDKSVKEVTMMVFHSENAPPVTVKSPMGEWMTKDKHPDYIRWHHEKTYDLLTINNPLKGAWKVSGEEDEDNRAFVVSDLKVVVDKLPANVFLFEKIPYEVSLQDDGRVIKKQDFLNTIDFVLNQVPDEPKKKAKSWKLRDDGRGYDRNAEDGFFGHRLSYSSKQLGGQSLNLEVKGKTLERRNRQRVQVHQTPVDRTEEFDEDYKQHNVIFRPKHKLVKPSTLALTAMVTDNEGNSEQITMVPEEGEEAWILNLPAKTDDYVYSITLDAKGKTVNGRDFHIVTPPFIVKAMKSAVKPKAFIAPIDRKAKVLKVHSVDPEAGMSVIFWVMCAGTFFTIFAVVLFVVWSRRQQAKLNLIRGGVD